MLYASSGQSGHHGHHVLLPAKEDAALDQENVKDKLVNALAMQLNRTTALKETVQSGQNGVLQANVQSHVEVVYKKWSVNALMVKLVN